MKSDKIGNLTFFNADNLEIMRDFADNEFDLAIVDPPYGIGAANMQMGNNYKKKWNKKDWDKNTPTTEYWNELFRISKNQIVWGGNYFYLPRSKCWVVWDKNNGESDFADGEMAWTSFDKPMRIKKIHWTGSASNWEDTKGKIHPTQKPIELYDWLIKNYAEPKQKILDTHLGSGSIAIAIENANRINNMGLQFTGIELDEEYYNAALQRFKIFAMQQTIIW